MGRFEKKLVAVMNKTIEPGIIMNALGHMCIGFGAHIGDKDLFLTDYKDADNSSHPYISKMPFIILRAKNSNKIRTLRQSALENQIDFIDYHNHMTIGTFEEQIERSSKTKEEELIYYGIVLYGNWDKVAELTKKFSLWK